MGVVLIMPSAKLVTTKLNLHDVNLRPSKITRYTVGEQSEPLTSAYPQVLNRREGGGGKERQVMASYPGPLTCT